MRLSHQIPGLENHPDLRSQFDRAARRVSCCGDRRKLVEKYTWLVRQRASKQPSRRP